MIARLITTGIGTFLMGFAISLLIILNEGTDTISVFYLGLQNQFGLELWLSCLLFNLVITTLVFLIDKSQLGMGTMINFLGVSFCLKYFPILLETVKPDQLPVLLSSFLVFFSVGLFGIGCGMYTSGKLGSAALESLSLALNQRTSYSLRIIRIMLDSLLVIAGLLLGASIGMGTILCVILVGPITQSVLSASNYRVSGKVMK